MLKNRQYGVIPYCLFFFKMNGGGKIKHLCRCFVIIEFFIIILYNQFNKDDR